MEGRDPFEFFIEQLKEKKNFSFSRWGDGEWSSLLALEPETRKNTDGHTYFKDMGTALAGVLKSRPQYWVGMQRFAREDRFPKEIEAFLSINNLYDLNWINADIWHHASIKGYFNQFFDAIVNRKVLLVGPKYLSPAIGTWRHEVISDTDCWKSVGFTIDQIVNYLDCYKVPEIEECEARKDCVILFCASMPTNYMIDQLYSIYGTKHTFLDMGSVFDPYVKRKSRSYHQKVIERLHG